MVGYKKKQKKRGNAGSLPSATDGNGLFAIRGGRQRSHVATTCASWQLTHLVSLPTAADGKGFAYSSGRQRLCLQWQTAKNAHICLQQQTAKACPAVTSS